MVINTIAAATTSGLTVTAVLDRRYPNGTGISDERMRYLEDRVLTRGAVRGEWNYAVLPGPERPGTGAGTGASRPRPRRPLNHPALTGMDPAACTPWPQPWTSRSAPARAALR